MSLMERLERQKKTAGAAHPAPVPGRSAERYAGAAPVTEEYAELKQQVHTEVIIWSTGNRAATGMTTPAEKNISVR